MVKLILSCLLLVVSFGCATQPESPSAAEPATVLAATADAGARSAVVYDIADHASLPDRLDIPLIRRGGYLLVPGAVNGEPVGTMMIDTGASLSVIAQGVAGRVGLEKDGQGRTVGVGGIESFDYYKVSDYTIGRSAAAGGVPGDALKLESEKMAGLSLLRFGRSLGISMGGIVGFTDLADVPFSLDGARRQLTIYNPTAFRPPRSATRQRLHRYRKLPMVRAELSDGRQRVEVWLIIDYGADNALTLPDTLLQRHPGVVSVNAAGTGRTRGIGGTVQSTQTWVRNFRVFDLDLQDVPVNFEPPPPSLEGPRLIGRIGNTLLQHFRLTFHAKHGWVYAEWNPTAEE
ncbi:MAG: aspartyl protease family protein [Planctomycetota bacterium]